MRHNHFRPLTDINITNLVDVTLVLLIIFMIAAPLIHSGVKVDLPRMQSGAEVIQEGILVSYTHDDQIYIDGNLVTGSDFENRLIKLWVQSGRKPVLLSADSNVPYGKVIGLIDKIKSVGVENLGLIVEPGKKQP